MDKQSDGTMTLADTRTTRSARVCDVTLGADFNPVMVRILWLQSNQTRVTAPGVRPARRMC